MKKIVNVGKFDRFIRLLLGMVSIALGIFLHWAFFYLAGLLIYTAIFGYCGIYAIFGIQTCPRNMKS